LGTDCAVATSGIAGPGGGTPEKPVGTVWIGAKAPTGMVVTEYHFPGNRERVINRATTTAMLMLIKLLKNK
jgi:PncC family amidohydrolase